MLSTPNLSYGFHTYPLAALLLPEGELVLLWKDKGDSSINGMFISVFSSDG